MQAFVVFRSTFIDERQWRMFSLSGLLIAATTALIGLIGSGVERVLLLLAAASLVIMIGLYQVYRTRGKVEQLLLDGDQLIRTRKLLVGTRMQQQRIGALTSYSFLAYDGRAMESRMDAWFRRANRQPDGTEYQTLLRDSGGVIWTRRQDFRSAAVEALPVWELNMVFKDGEVWTWRYKSIPKGKRLAMAEFLEALARV